MVVEWVTLLMRKQVEGKESMRSHHRWCENGEEWRDSALIAIYGPGCLLLMAVGHLTVTQMISSLLIVGRVHSSQCALSCMLEHSRSGGTNSLVTWPSMLSLWGEHWGLPTTVALFFITLSMFFLQESQNFLPSDDLLSNIYLPECFACILLLNYF